MPYIATLVEETAYQYWKQISSTQHSCFSADELANIEYKLFVDGVETLALPDVNPGDPVFVNRTSSTNLSYGYQNTSGAPFEGGMFSTDNGSSFSPFQLPENINAGTGDLKYYPLSSNNPFQTLVEGSTLYSSFLVQDTSTPGDPDVVYVRILRSVNGGATWATFVTVDTGVNAIGDLGDFVQSALITLEGKYALILGDNGLPGAVSVRVYEATSLSGPWTLEVDVSGSDFSLYLFGPQRALSCYDTTRIYSQQASGVLTYLEHDAGVWSVASVTPPAGKIFGIPAAVSGIVYYPYYTAVDPTDAGIAVESTPGSYTLDTISAPGVWLEFQSTPAGVYATALDEDFMGGGKTYLLDLAEEGELEPTEEDPYSPIGLGDLSPVLRQGPAIRTINENALAVQEALSLLADIANPDEDVLKLVIDLNGYSLLDIEDDASGEAIKIRS